MKTSEITYKNIIKEVDKFTKDFKNKFELPKIPQDGELHKYNKIIETKYPHLLKDIAKYFDDVKADKNNALEHSLWVSKLAGYIADKETKVKNNSIVEKTIRAGLLHDIDRHLGFGDIHMEKGAKTAEKFLRKYGLYDEKIIKTIRHHDDSDYRPSGDPEFEVMFSSVYDADHLRYGLEREKDFWEMKERKGVKAEDVIHDYHWMEPYLDSWKTKFGKEVCKRWINYAYKVAEHIEDKFE